MHRSQRGHGRPAKKVALAVALRHGIACRSCRPGRCNPTELNELDRLPLEVECQSCTGEGDDCESCGGTGRHEYYGCPFTHLDGDEMSLLEDMEAFDCGHLPCGGGLHDQPAIEMERIWLARTEDERWKAREQQRLTKE